MKKSAVAIAITADYAQYQESPFAALLDSAKNLGSLAFHFMYGTPENSRLTYIFAIALTLFGIGLDHAQHASLLQACPA